MPFLVAPDGVRLHYDTEGSGPPLLLHLGAGADSELWRAAGYLDRLAASRTCILFDHRGHGLSDHPATPQANHVDRYADDVVALINHLDLGSVAFFGWSNAVSVGLRVAQQHPGVFDSLILFGPIARPVPAHQLRESVQQRVAAMRERGWWSILDPMVEAEKYPVPQWFLDRVLATDTGPWIAFSEARPDWNWSPWDALPRVTAPTLILAGELEDPDDVMADVSAQMPRAQRVRIPGREHINAFLDVDFVLPLVMTFLREHHAGAAQRALCIDHP